jgi:TPR repeat protein
MAKKQSTKLSTGRLRCRRCLLRVVTAVLLGAVSIVNTVPVAAADSPIEPQAGAVIRPSDLLARAQAGDPWAQLNLGAAFDHGIGGFPLDPVRAVNWYRHAAEAGLAEAQFNLAHCLATGNGVPRDGAEALRWMELAAEQDLASAQYLAGVMFAEGMGTTKDTARAIAWLQRAVANGNTDAARLLKGLQVRD